MSVSSIGNTPPTTAGSPATSGAGTALGTGDFLKLLVAELKNQDPMNPASGTEFLAQTAQFTSVEKLTQMAQQYSSLIASQQATEATGLIGRTVGYTDANGSPAQGIVSGISLVASGPVLKVGTIDVPLTSVSSVTG
ncbi:MAG TPA: flagellar hook capping FlgD N-terminal domain-containing protein [Candidatus Nanopelagicaceae bacterium]|nr:flagellar hook capping FlgD N-terminal domain-containing protein [Candidatus Nanopelagicaceae bacterium]